MDRNEEVNITYLLKDVAEKQQQHINASNSFREEMKAKMAMIDTHGEYIKNQLTINTNDVASLKDSRTKQSGAIWAFGIIWTGILALLAIFKN